MVCRTCSRDIRLVAHGLCSGCYSVEYRAGHFTKQRSDAMETFLKSYEVDSNGCWLWTGALLATGYGALRNDEGKTERAHRFAFRKLKARIPKGRILLHQCDVRRCVNPDHLRVGTHSANMHEAYERGRISPPRRKLSDEQIREIRSLHGVIPQKQIAVQMNISEGVVSNIINGRIWKNVL